MAISNWSLLRGVVVSSTARHPWSTEIYECTVSDGIEEIQCVTPSPTVHYAANRWPLQTQTLKLIGLEAWYADRSTTPVLVATEDAADPDDPLSLLPAGFCPVPGLIDRALQLIDEIRSKPLRLMVDEIMHSREVFPDFWRMPASAKHHHAFPGGLAAHSVEVAQDLATQSYEEPHERELGIAGGLLHDIGKLWSYTDDMLPNAPGLAQGHELTGLCKLSEPISKLERAWPDGAYAMRVLLLGQTRMRANGTLPISLLSRLNAADRRSCEIHRHIAGRDRVWRPGAFATTP